MKKINKALSLTLATLVSMPVLAENVNSEDFSFGGRVEARANLADSDFSDKSRVRFGGQGKHQINDDVTAVGKFEFEFTQANDGSETSVKEVRNTSVDNNLRYLYAGIETSHGTLTYGTQNNAVTYLTDFTDMAEVFSGYTNESINASADRAKDTVLYSVTKGNLRFDASANLTEEQNGGGAMLAYKLLPSLELSAGYSATEAAFAETDSSDVYMLGARYTNDTVLVSGLVQKGSLAGEDFDAVDAFASYGFGENKVSISYNYYSADQQAAPDVNFVAFEYGRYIGDVAAFAGYKVALNNDTSAGTGNNGNADEFIVGARYSF